MPEKNKTVNRDISWLSFNARVLQEAEDASVPLIERFKFLGIFSSNLDEFFRVRVASLKRIDKISEYEKKQLGGNPKKILTDIHDSVVNLTDKFDDVYLQLERELEKENIYIINETELNEEQGTFVKNYFRRKVRPTLVPVMLGSGQGAPMLKDKSIYLAIKLIKEGVPKSRKFALIELPNDVIPRFLVLPTKDGKQYVMFLDDVIRYCLDDMFYVFDYDQIGAYTIKLTRDAELDMDDGISEGIIQKLSKSLKERKKGRPVRFIYDETMPPDLHNFIIRKLKLHKNDNLIPGARYHNFKDFMNFPDMGNPNLLYKPLEPFYHKDIPPKKSLIQTLNKKDILLQYPYHSTGHMVDLFREAAIDPNVISVKATLYRVAQNSAIVNALINAVRNGKHVTVVVELQARFDEENNIYWANKLKEEGARVIFGLPGRKVHCKLCLITRKDKRGHERYAYVSTGNFNEKTSAIYADTALLTSDKRITTEIHDLFEFLESNLKVGTYKHLLISPFFMRQEINKLIDKEIKNARAGITAFIDIKVNSLIDYDIIMKLYDASKAGVKIRLIVRGICGLIPNIKDLSENIEVISIVDRYLEHSRVFIFGNAGNEKIYFGSADWMTRNLDHRIEVICPVFDKKIKKQLLEYFSLQWSDNVKARIINAEQSNPYRIIAKGERKIRSQEDYYAILKHNNE